MTERRAEPGYCQECAGPITDQRRRLYCSAECRSSHRDAARLRILFSARRGTLLVVADRREWPVVFEQLLRFAGADDAMLVVRGRVGLDGLLRLAVDRPDRSRPRRPRRSGVATVEDRSAAA